jgi:hypothetical protein
MFIEESLFPLKVVIEDRYSDVNWWKVYNNMSAEGPFKDREGTELIPARFDTPFGPSIEPIYLYILAVLVIIIVVGAAAFIVRRKKKLPEEVENSQSELRLTRTRFRRNFGHR